MICLHITAHFDGQFISFEASRMEREDARQDERIIIDTIHDNLKAIIETVFEGRIGHIVEIDRKD